MRWKWLGEFGWGYKYPCFILLHTKLTWTWMSSPSHTDLRHHLSSPFVRTHVSEHKIPSFKAGNSSYLWCCGCHRGTEFTILINVWNLDSVILEHWFQVYRSKLSCHSYITCSLYTENSVQWSKPKPEPSFKVKEMKIFWCTSS